MFKRAASCRCSANSFPLSKVNGVTQRRRQGPEQPLDRIAHRPSTRLVRLRRAQKPALSLHQRNQHAAAARADDGVALPIAKAGSPIDHSGTSFNERLGRQLPAPIAVASPTSSAPQVTTPKGPQRRRLGADPGINRGRRNLSSAVARKRLGSAAGDLIGGPVLSQTAAYKVIQPPIVQLTLADTPRAPLPAQVLGDHRRITSLPKV